MSFAEEVAVTNQPEMREIDKSPPLDFMEEEFHLTKSTE